MIKCNSLVLRQDYNTLATLNSKGRVELNPAHSITKIEIILFSTKTEDFKNILHRYATKKPITIKYDNKKYMISDYTISLNPNNISQIVIDGYIDQKDEPEFEIIN